LGGQEGGVNGRSGRSGEGSGTAEPVTEGEGGRRQSERQERERERERERTVLSRIGRCVDELDIHPGASRHKSVAENQSS